MIHFLKHHAISILALLALSAAAIASESPQCLPGKWNLYDRATLEQTSDSVTIGGGYLGSEEALGDCEFKFRARAPKGEEQVQIWAGIRMRDRESRYMIGLRGGDNNDLYFVRYAPDGGDRLLGINYLDFKPAVGTCYDVRVLVKGNRFQVYLGDEKVPRINSEDSEALWQKGGAVLGGGWLKTEFANVSFKPLEGAALAQFEAAGKTVWRAPDTLDREALRAKQRDAYTPLTIEKLQPGRNEISLDGQWLFMPEQLQTGQPTDPGFDDSRWHTMPVPAFWTPSLGWLHGEPAFTYLKEYPEAARHKGISDNIFNQEIARLDGCTFDWRATKSAWYRHRIVLPDELDGRRFELCFDAIAKVAKIWVNGREVGTHIGMFGDVKCDITDALKPGENVIVVHVAQDWVADSADDDKVEGVAVTVPVTKRMLRALPHAIYEPRAAGIWQPVKLVVSAPVFIEDIYVQPGLDGAKIDVTLGNTSGTQAKVDLAYSITSAEKDVLASKENAVKGDVPPDGKTTLQFETPKLTPKLWTPSEPNLYNLEVRLMDGGREIDRKSVRFGFRTFETAGDQLLLNGKPYWIRGGNHFPVYLRPNDSEYARVFLRLAHDGNVRATRTVCAPMTDAWMDACDEIGMGVSYEGIWPWLMLKGEPPDPKLLGIWKEDFSRLIRKYRNHPSLLLWTVNNEMKFYIYDRDNEEMLKRKWAIVTDMIREMRALDPTRPIVADSGYVRKTGHYDKVIAPNRFDDGDIDDAHRYFGWYDPSFFHYFNGEYAKEVGTPGRPLISQEMCGGGYARSDDGQPVRSYLYLHQTPQALIGDKAYPNADPAWFLRSQAFMTKELAEAIRRSNRADSAGILHFSYTTWFRDLLNPEGIRPFPAYHAYKMAHAPVLVSAELFGRHAYAGTILKRRVCVVNDSEDASAIPPSRLTWSIEGDGKVLSEGTVDVPKVDYYTNHWMDVDFVMPEKLPQPRVNAQLKLKLEADSRLISENSYDLVIASREWAQAGLPDKLTDVMVYDPRKISVASLDGINAERIDSLANLASLKPRVLIVGDAEALAADAKAVVQMKDYLAGGGNVLLFNAGKHLVSLFPEQIKSHRALAGKDGRRDPRGEIVTMKVPESRVFDELEPMDLSWFEMGRGALPYACGGDYQINRSRPDVTALAWHSHIHGYLQKPEEIMNYSGTPLLEIRCGKGRLISSEMALEAGANDPIPRRLLSNIIADLQAN